MKNKGLRLVFIFVHILIAYLQTCEGKIYDKEERLRLRNKVGEMFNHAYNNYISFGLPYDELDSLRCSGIGFENDKIKRNCLIYNLTTSKSKNDSSSHHILSGCYLTLIDSLSTLALMKNKEEFKYAVNYLIDNLNFDVDNIVSVFEINIRILGGLLSAHLICIDEKWGMDMTQDGYSNELLSLAKDLGDRLLVSFQNNIGLPSNRINLKTGRTYKSDTNAINPAEAGSFILEFGILSKLTGDPAYQIAADRSINKLWDLRSPINLIGSQINVDTGYWIDQTFTIGAEIDSFLEYLFKGSILFNNQTYYDMFSTFYRSIIKYNLTFKQKSPEVVLHKLKDTEESSDVEDNSTLKYNFMDVGSFYYKCNMNTGMVTSLNINSLGSFFPGIQVSNGDIYLAIKHFLSYYLVLLKYGVLPEEFNVSNPEYDVKEYHLRPELIESAYMLYRATKDEFFLEVAENIMSLIDKYCRTECGYSTVVLQDCTSIRNEFHELNLDPSNFGLKFYENYLYRQTGRMESFFVGETLKYLYLIFDDGNVIHKDKYLRQNMIFSTEAHPLYIPEWMRKPSDFKNVHISNIKNFMKYDLSINNLTMRFLKSRNNTIEINNNPKAKKYILFPIYNLMKDYNPNIIDDIRYIKFFCSSKSTNGASADNSKNLYTQLLSHECDTCELDPK